MAGISKGSVGNDATAEWFLHMIKHGRYPDAIEEKWIQSPTGLNFPKFHQPFATT